VDSQGLPLDAQKGPAPARAILPNRLYAGQQITLPASVNPTAFCIDKDDRLLLADAGQDLNIKVLPIF
jgi:hypothetical protein